MAILEYKLHKTNLGLIAPEWVEDGGYWLDPDNNTLIGWSPNESARKYHIPDSVTSHTNEELITRVLDIHSRYPIKNEQGADLSDSEVTEMVNSWLSTRT